MNDMWEVDAVPEADARARVKIRSIRGAYECSYNEFLMMLIQKWWNN